MPSDRPFCSDVSRENLEPLAGTASRVDHWILVEYRGLWGHDVLPGSGLSDQVKANLREQAAARPNTKLLFVRRSERRGRPELRVMWGSSPERGASLFHAQLESHEAVIDEANKTDSLVRYAIEDEQERVGVGVESPYCACRGSGARFDP